MNFWRSTSFYPAKMTYLKAKNYVTCMIMNENPCMDSMEILSFITRFIWYYELNFALYLVRIQWNEIINELS